MINLGALLESKGHKVIPFAPHNQKNLANSYESTLPPEVNFQKPGPLDIARYIYSRPAAQSIGRILSENSVNIAHLHIYYGQLSASILGPLTKARIPIVQTLHEYKLLCPVYSFVSHGKICEKCEGKYFWKALSHRCNRGSFVRSALSAVESYVSKYLGAVDKISHFIAPSEFMRTICIRMGVPKDKITTISNFMDVSSFSLAQKQGHSFLYVGRLSSEKGIMTLLRASQKIKDVPLIIVGDGVMRPMIEDYVRRHDLNHVRLVGFKSLTEIADLTHQAICSIVPSEWYENYPYSVMESQAFGCPVVGSKIGGIPEMISHGDDGWLFEAGNHEDLYVRLRWMADHREQALRMGRAARLKVERTANDQRHYDSIVSLYNQLI